MSLIKLNISKKFDKTIFDNASLEISEGESVAIIGQSGYGKTTLLNIIGLLDNEYEGEVIISDTNVTSLNNKDKEKVRLDNFGYVFQDFNLIDYLSVYDNIILPLKYRKIKDTSYADEIIKDLEISDLRDKKVNLLSGGEKQRVAIARAIVTKPKILLADEPTGSLDETNTKNVMNILKKINEKYGITLIVVTHNSSILNEFERVVKIESEKIKEVSNFKK